jgi:hypothetical protein
VREISPTVFDVNSEYRKKKMIIAYLNELAYIELILLIDDKTSNGKVAFNFVKGFKNKGYVDWQCVHDIGILEKQVCTWFWSIISQDGKTVALVWSQRESSPWDLDDWIQRSSHETWRVRIQHHG